MFKPFDFTFTPPATVPSAPMETTPTSPAGSVGSQVSGSQSRAGQLVTKLKQLSTMSRYLQDAIVARTGRIAIEINPAVDPVMARALVSIYGTPNPPTFITMVMYNQLLDAHMGALQLEMAVGNDSTVQANPLQVGDLMTVVNTVSNHLVESPSYNNWLPLQLASLKSDAVVFQSMIDSLGSYPAFYATPSLVPSSFSPATIQAAQLDVSQDIFDYQDDALNRFGSSYANVYQGMATTSVVEHDANTVINEYFNQPLQNVLRLAALFNAIRGLNFKTAMTDLQGDITNYVFARLASETHGMLSQCDQLVSLSVSPIQGVLGSLGHVVSAVQKQSINVGVTAAGVTSGLSKANLCVQSNPYNKVNVPAATGVFVDGLGVVSGGLKYLAETIDWAQRQVTNGLLTVDVSFRQLLERRMKSQSDRNQLMCAMKCLDAILQLTNGVAGAFQKGTVTQNSSPQQKQEAVNQILASLQTNTDTTFTSTDGAGDAQLTINASDMPTPPPDVVNVLQRAGFKSTIATLKV